MRIKRRRKQERVKRRRKQELVDLAKATRVPAEVLIELQRAGELPQDLNTVTGMDRQALQFVRWMLCDKDILRRQVSRLSRTNRAKLLSTVQDVGLRHWERIALKSFVNKYEAKYAEMDRATAAGEDVEDVPIGIESVLNVVMQHCNVAGTLWVKSRLRELRDIARKRVRRRRQAEGERIW